MFLLQDILDKRRIRKIKGELISFSRMIDELIDKEIVYIGEAHFCWPHAEKEAAIVAKAFLKKSKLQIAVEEHASEEQSKLNRYLKGCNAGDWLVWPGGCLEDEIPPLYKVARKNKIKVIAIEKARAWSLSQREKHWSKIIMPHLKENVLTFVVLGNAHIMECDFYPTNFPERMERHGIKNYGVISFYDAYGIKKRQNSDRIIKNAIIRVENPSHYDHLYYIIIGTIKG